MHESLRLYDASLEILAQEAEALEREDTERLLELCEQRMALMTEAWEKRTGCDTALLTERLEAIQKALPLLTSKASTQKESLRMILQSSRRENMRLAGYSKALKSMQNAVIVSKAG